MLIYNITIKVNSYIHEEWVQWMQDIYIAAAMKSGCFTKHQFVRLVDIDEQDGPTYALQLFASSKENYNHYIENYLPQNEITSYEKWGSDVISFSTLMQIIN